MLTPSLRTTSLAVIAALALAAPAIAGTAAPPSSAHPTDDQTFPGLASQARAATTVARPTEGQVFPGLAHQGRAAADAQGPATTVTKSFDWGAATIGAGVAIAFFLITLTTGFAAIRGRPRARPVR